MLGDLAQGILLFGLCGGFVGSGFEDLGMSSGDSKCVHASSWRRAPGLSHFTALQDGSGVCQDRYL